MKARIVALVLIVVGAVMPELHPHPGPHLVPRGSTRKLGAARRLDA